MGLILGVWVVCGLVGALLLGESNRAGIGCLLGGALGPLGVIVAAILRLEKKPAIQPAATAPATAPLVVEEKKCPDCAEMVKADARKCRFCGHQFG